MRIARRFAVGVAALSVCFVATVAKAAPFQAGSAASKDGAVTVVYDPANGSLNVNGGGTVKISTFELKSAGSKFIPANVTGDFSGLFDVKTTSKLFKLFPAGFGELAIGNALPAGLSDADVMADLDVNGSILPSGGLTAAAGGGPYLYVVPEPSSLILIGLGLLGLLGIRRK